MDEKRAFERFAIEVLRQDKTFRGENKTDSTHSQNREPVSRRYLGEGGLPFTRLELPLTAELMFDFDELKSPEDPNGTLTIIASGYVQRSGPEGTAICFSEDYKVLSALDRPEGSQTEAFVESIEGNHSRP